MPLRLNVGVSKKLGLPAYSSIGASCNLEVELDSGMLRDLAGLHDQVRVAFVAARQAVNDELVRLQSQAESATSRPALTTAEPRQILPLARPEVTHPRPRQPATPSQVRAIVALARRQDADLDGLLGDLGVARADDLSITQASKLIDRLKSDAQG